MTEKAQLTATCNPKEGPKFTFTNTYSVGELPSSITDQIKIDKKLTGRDLKKGEFSFELLENGKVVATGSNDASGNVTFDKITYNKPGNHTYTVREVNNDLGGVTYDDQLYTVYTRSSIMATARSEPNIRCRSDRTTVKQFLQKRTPSPLVTNTRLRRHQ